MQTSESILSLRKLLLKNLLFHLILTQEVNQMPYGQITLNVQLKDGIVLVETINIVKNRRKKYKVVDNSEEVW